MGKVNFSLEALSFGGLDFWTLIFLVLAIFQVSTPAKIETTGNYCWSSKLQTYCQRTETHIVHLA